MMSSRVLSRLLPVAEGDISVFDGMRRDQHRRPDDLESHHDYSFKEDDRDHEDDPERLFLNEPATQNPTLSPQSGPSSLPSPELERLRPRWLEERKPSREEEDEDVPESLLLEAQIKDGTDRRPSQPSNTAGPSRIQAKAEAQWKATQEQHKLHKAEPSRPSTGTGLAARGGGATGHAMPARSSAEAEAMWLYTNADNLDAFLLEVYQYFAEHGVYSILLERLLSLLKEVFVFSFAMFLTTCIDYSLVPVSKSTEEIMIPKCMAKASWFKNAALFFFITYVLWRIHQYIGSVRRLFRMHNFYHYALGIQDQDIQTVSWVRVVDGLIRIQNANIATADQPATVKAFLKDNYGRPQQRINAETIANRLMRQDNFYVAMYNKDILDFTLPIPLFGNRQFYSKSLEWCIDFCLTNFIFDEQGNIRPFCLDVRNRHKLIDALRRRLQFAALTSVVVAPVNILRFCVMYFFRYATDFWKNPSRASARAFTPFAEWKIREFNELDHLFQRRLQQAYPFANEYLKQFPKDKTDQICRFVGFVSGAIAAVLGIAALLDHELFLGFQVTPGRTAFFWFSAMAGLFTFTHGMLPDENETHDPVLHLKEVLMFVHYMPTHWKGRLHSTEVRSEFSAMYQLRILIFFEEILSLILAPWILLRNANDRSDRIIDFFREHAVHVDSIGYQCNFAVFGFKKDLNAEDATAVLSERDGLRDDYFGLKDDKMAASVHNFMQYYSHYKHRQGSRRTPSWQPPPAWPPLMTSGGQQGDTAAVIPRAVPGRGNYGRASELLASRSQFPLSAQRATRPTARRDSDRTRDTNAPAFSKRQVRGSSSKPAISESRLMAQDSDLSDYGGLPGDPLDSETDGGEGGAKGGASENTGVLGMLYQFSKAQTDKGAGITI